MTPDDLVMVRQTWAVLRRRRAEFLEQLEAALDASTCSTSAGDHARLLVDGAEALLDSLETPSQLRARVRALAVAGPPEAALPCCGTDGSAWRRAASVVCAPWSTDEDTAWKHAWLLLADVLAEDSLAPFGAPRACGHGLHGPPT
jgi:hypothetical protein